MTKDELKSKLATAEGAYAKAKSNPNFTKEQLTMIQNKIASIKKEIAEVDDSSKPAKDKDEEVISVVAKEKGGKKGKRAGSKPTKARRKPGRKTGAKKSTRSHKAKAEATPRKRVLTEEECADLLKEKKAQIKKNRERINKRKKAGKAPELTVAEAVEKTKKTVEKKVEKLDKKDKVVTKTQAESISDDVVAIVEVVKEAMKSASDGNKFVKSVIAELNKLLK
jgi:hypothetical protein